MLRFKKERGSRSRGGREQYFCVVLVFVNLISFASFTDMPKRQRALKPTDFSVVLARIIEFAAVNIRELEGLLLVQK
jgi:hypothetical protein